MNKSKCIKAVKSRDNPYEQYSQRLLKDTRLSTISRGLMIEMLNHDFEGCLKPFRPPYVLYKDVIMRESKLTKHAFTKAWKELQEYKYLEVINHGKLGWEINLNENGDLKQPFENLDSPPMAYHRWTRTK
jgi:hypothetical protein